MEIACQASYPLNSENASPPGTFTVYLSCAEMAQPPKTASDTVITAIESLPLPFIASLLYQAILARNSNIGSRPAENVPSGRPACNHQLGRDLERGHREAGTGR